MPRYKITLEYDGGPFVGWQRQINGMSVQQALEEAIHAFSGQTVRTFGAGRTDSGVHALGQVAHFDIEKTLTPHRIRDALNYHLKPHPIAVLSVEIVDETFHARFLAYERHYLYRIATRRPPVVFEKGRVWQVVTTLDTEAMHDAAQIFVGEHDFTTFRAALCQAKSPVKQINAISVSRVADEIHIAVSAPSFLHNQVRSFVGTLKLVGEGRWSKEDVRAALEACQRSACGPVAPPEGLYLVKVNYPENSGEK